MGVYQQVDCTYYHDGACRHPDRRGDSIELPRCLLVQNKNCHLKKGVGR